MAAAKPAGAAARSRPAAIAGGLRRSTPTCSQDRLRRIRLRPVSISLSRSNVPPQRMVSATQAVIGSRSEAGASGERKTKRARGRSGNAAGTGERKNDQAPPAAASPGESMKPSIRPIDAQYEVTAATKAKTGSSAPGAASPNRLRRANPAAVQTVTQTVLTIAPGSTSSQMRDGSSIGV